MVVVDVDVVDVVVVATGRRAVAFAVTVVLVVPVTNGAKVGVVAWTIGASGGIPVGSGVVVVVDGTVVEVEVVVVVANVAPETGFDAAPVPTLLRARTLSEYEVASARPVIVKGDDVVPTEIHEPLFREYS